MSISWQISPDKRRILAINGQTQLLDWPIVDKNLIISSWEQMGQKLLINIKVKQRAILFDPLLGPPPQQQTRFDLSKPGVITATTSTARQTANLRRPDAIIMLRRGQRTIIEYYQHTPKQIYGLEAIFEIAPIRNKQFGGFDLAADGAISLNLKYINPVASCPELANYAQIPHYSTQEGLLQESQYLAKDLINLIQSAEVGYLTRK